MTVVTAARITTAAQALAIATELAADFAQGAAERDHTRRLPHEELDQLSASGLLAITVPAAFGGADLPPSVVAEVFRILATADPNIAQVPHSHFVYLNLLRLAGTPAQQREYFGRVLAGARIANAQSERGGATVADIATTVRPVDGRFVVEGTKYYCTGSLFADVLAVLARLDDPHGVSGLAAGEYVAFVAALEPGVRIVDDWDALGQRTTGSGTVEFDAVTVAADQLVARAAAVHAPTGYGAFAQLLHAAIDAGIARGALEAAAEFVRTRSRPWFEAEVDRAIDDPLVVQRFGELAVSVAAAESALVVAGAAVDGAIRGEHQDDAARASIAVATAKILADRAANEVSAAIFEVGGTRSAAAGHRLDRFWRNARTHTLHDPVRWKYQHIGRAVLQDRPPPLHGVI
ncbi:SfnB family sulfur acquisition oxidoreductase [Nocardia sp. MH4]|uniref:SfnB family sulfur acquisition oxidoreductase n=1 Tax=Nocardia sp. MH4 TaxID=1768677 RepID=UPI001C4ECD88|nr:SfnB family sulfur acquisition oxidoreductase [Nocardia sp. MH4]MBW0270444.1 SfnB family sulfur acquisition oxidoreductase [Nocardia sp. MH4]